MAMKFNDAIVFHTFKLKHTDTPTPKLLPKNVHSDGKAPIKLTKNTRHI